MAVRRPAAVMFAALCLVTTPAFAAPSPNQAPAQPAAAARTPHRPNKALTNVIIYGSIGAIATALGTLRKRRGHDLMGGDEENTKH